MVLETRCSIAASGRRPRPLPGICVPHFRSGRKVFMRFAGGILGREIALPAWIVDRVRQLGTRWDVVDRDRRADIRDGQSAKYSAAEIESDLWGRTYRQQGAIPGISALPVRGLPARRLVQCDATRRCGRRQPACPGSARRASSRCITLRGRRRFPLVSVAPVDRVDVREQQFYHDVHRFAPSTIDAENVPIA
jgi:hypothetical protein